MRDLSSRKGALESAFCQYVSLAQLDWTTFFPQTCGNNDPTAMMKFNIWVVVDRSDHKVRVYRGDEVIGIETVAVDMAKYPTPIGSWKFYRVDLNPEWNPPKSNWAKGRKRAPPGRSENPMGRARLVFNMPYTIHGTGDLVSLGMAASHGSVRISKDIFIDLAELLLRAGSS